MRVFMERLRDYLEVADSQLDAPYNCSFSLKDATFELLKEVRRQLNGPLPGDEVDDQMD